MIGDETEESFVAVVTPDAEMQRFGGNRFKIRREHRLNGGSLLEIVVGEESQRIELAHQLDSFGYIRRFEDTWFPRARPRADGDELLRSYFDTIAIEYDSKISKLRNAACYALLMRKAIEKKANLFSILDFGCGPGTIVETLAERDVLDAVTGFDFSDEMRRLAEQRGLKTIGPADFESLPGCVYDLITMCYVMHFQIDQGIYERLVRLLKVGGTIVGNVHKNMGLEPLLEWLHSLKGIEVYYEASVFGTLITIRKSGRNVS